MLLELHWVTTKLEVKNSAYRKVSQVTKKIIFSNRTHTVLPPGIANLINLEILNLANNQLQELPLSLSSMPKLRILNVSINKLNTLPRGFGAFPVLEVLDLSYNNLNEHTLPGNFFMMGTHVKCPDPDASRWYSFKISQKPYVHCIWATTILNMFRLKLAIWKIYKL